VSINSPYPQSCTHGKSSHRSLQSVSNPTSSIPSPSCTPNSALTSASSSKAPTRSCSISTLERTRSLRPHPRASAAS
jgi:hypothetical protein